MNLAKQDFHPRQKVLLYNSRLRMFSNKLKSKWYGPFVITKDFASGAVEI